MLTVDTGCLITIDNFTCQCSAHDVLILPVYFSWHCFVQGGCKIFEVLVLGGHGFDPASHTDDPFRPSPQESIYAYAEIAASS